MHICFQCDAGMQTIVYWKCVVVTFARVKDWVNLIKKLKLASVCFPEKKKKYCKALCFPSGLVLRFLFGCVNYHKADGSKNYFFLTCSF